MTKNCMNCKNCNKSIENNFCSYCGQRTKIDRINLKSTLFELQNSLLQFDKGFFHTIKELSIRPGTTIKNFINGKRKFYYKPFSYVFLTTTLYVFIMFLLDRDSFISEFISSFQRGWNDSATDNNFGNPSDENIFSWLKKNQIYLVLIYIPLFSLASFFSHIKGKYNYFEHLVIQLYISGHQMMIYLIFSFFIFNDEILAILTILGSSVYGFWSYTKIFNTKTILNTFLRYVLMYVLFIIILLVTSLITTLVSVLIYKIFQLQ